MLSLNSRSTTHPINTSKSTPKHIIFLSVLGFILFVLGVLLESQQDPRLTSRTHPFSCIPICMGFTGLALIVYCSIYLQIAGHIVVSNSQ
jgi:uncharacterized membrane protein